MSTDIVDLDPMEYQRRILPHVSRTFALTIPQLPSDIADLTTNAYLLCRIADTIEDEPGLSAEAKSRAHAAFLDALDGRLDAEAFGEHVASELTRATSTHERDLIRHADKVVAYTRSLPATQQEVLTRCVAIMCRGMSEYQRNASLAGLRNLADADRYCYYVAGVVGEMLTELFTLHSNDVWKQREAMLALGPSFGEGLQLTNILKDFWEDRSRGACWLPRDVFAQQGIDLAAIRHDNADERFARAIDYMVGVAHEHLRDAMRYTLMIPASEVGIRRFCLWAIGMAVLTLWRIHRNPYYRQGRDVKISRWMVRAVITGSNLTARHDWLLKTLFATVTTGLPRHKKPIDPQVSDWEQENGLTRSASVSTDFGGGSDTDALMWSKGGKG